MPEEKPQEHPPQDLTPAEVESMLEGQPAQPEEDRGMGALEPMDTGALEEIGGGEVPEDNAMHAVAPIPSDADGATPAPTPSAEIPTPPPEAMRGAPLISAATARDFTTDPLGKGITPPIAPPPADVAAPPNAAMVQKLVTDETIQALWQKTETLQKRITEEIDDINQARALLEQLRAARAYLMAGRDNYEEAARSVGEVEYQLHWMARVREYSRTTGRWILIYEIIWTIGLAIAMFLVPYLLRRYAPFFGYENTMANKGIQTVGWLIDGFKSMFWGGIGGVTGALHALWRHIAARQDFDKQYAMWYYTNPLMGVALGAFIYLVVQAGLVSITGGAQSSVENAVPAFVLAWLSGFQQNVAYDIVRRLLKVFQLETTDKPSFEPKSSKH